MKRLATLIGVAALAFGAAGAASAADMPMNHDGAGAMHAAMGEHSMPGKVTMVNHKTGLVHVLSMGMHLTVHFPPSTIEKLKAGDKIILHLGYSIGG